MAREFSFRDLRPLARGLRTSAKADDRRPSLASSNSLTHRPFFRSASGSMPACRRFKERMFRPAWLSRMRSPPGRRINFCLVPGAPRVPAGNGAGPIWFPRLLIWNSTGWCKRVQPEATSSLTLDALRVRVPPKSNRCRKAHRSAAGRCGEAYGASARSLCSVRCRLELLLREGGGRRARLQVLAGRCCLARRAGHPDLHPRRDRNHRLPATTSSVARRPCHDPRICADARRRRIAAAMMTARAWSMFSRLARAESDSTDPDRAIRPSNTAHSSSAIGDVASITSSDGSSRSRLLSLPRASILPIRPRAQAADVATPWSRSSRRSIKSRISSASGRAQRHASARMRGSACRNSWHNASSDRTDPRRAAALNATCNPGPCTTARSIISDTACAASRPPMMARASIAAVCSGIMRRAPNPVKLRHSAASAGTAATSRRRPASAASLQPSASVDAGIAAIKLSSSISAGSRACCVLRERAHSFAAPLCAKRSSCCSSIPICLRARSIQPWDLEFARIGRL